MLTLVLVLLGTHAIRQDDGACASADLAAAADKVAEAFDTHALVFLGSTHGDVKIHEFLLCLLSRSGFADRTTDVLVEWATPIHQSIADRYLIDLESVPDDSLALLWFDSDAPELWARLPLIPWFYAAVRDLNAQRARDRRLRVIGGSAPLPWAVARSAQDLARVPFKTNWSAHVITEHFGTGSGRRLLVVFGEGHIHHSGGTLMADVVAGLDRSRLFVVGTIRDAGGDPAALARLGDPSRPFFRAARPAGFPTSGPYPDDLFYAHGALADFVDAIVYLGPSPDRSLADGMEFTERQRVELARRATVMGDLRGLMELRLRNRTEWFHTHPNDLQARPQG